MTSYLLVNNYIDTSCQKGGVPGFPGCVEHLGMIWEQIQTAKCSKSDLYVVWLDLANAYRSVPVGIFLPGKFKVWCYQFTLYQRLMWPLKLCDTTSTTALKMDSKANNYIRKWLGLPQCLPNTALFGINTLKLPLKSISLGYKQEKVRFVFELRDSPDLSVQNTKAEVCTGRKWNAMQTLDQVTNRLKHQEIVGLLQPGWASFEWGTAQDVVQSHKEGKERPCDV